MVHTFSYELQPEIRIKIQDFLKSLPSFSIEHFPDWHMYTNKKVCYHQFYVDNQLVGLASVTEHFRLTARLQFGPMVVHSDFENSILNTLITHYKNKSFVTLYIQTNNLYSKSVSRTSLLGYQAQELNSDSWSTIVLDLHADPILETISKHHKRLITKANKVDLVFREIQKHEIPLFVDGYVDMYRKRNLPINATAQQLALENKFNLLLNSQLGVFYGVFHKNSLIGGMLIVNQNDKYFYDLGFSNHAYKSIPILHFAFYHLILTLKNGPIKWLDFGGYNRFVKSSDQVFNINKFKLGFSNNIIDYEPQIQIIFKPFMYSLLKLYKSISKLSF